MERSFPTEAPIRSHRRWIGPAIVAYKKLVRSLVRPYLRTVFEAQRQEVAARAKDAAEGLIAASREIEALREEGRRHQDRLTTLEAAEPPSPLVAEPAPSPPIPESAERCFDRYYVAFLNRFGPWREERERQTRHYVAILKHGLEASSSDGSGDQYVVDLGCGRGELVELLGEDGVAALGVDANAACVAEARGRGLKIQCADALDHLRSLREASLGGVSCLGLVEHLPRAAVLELFELCYSRLAVGAALVVETINPLSVAAARAFDLDPTRERPLHPETAHFLLDEIGFPSIDLQFLAPPPSDAQLVEMGDPNAEKLNGLLFGCAAYAVIAYR